MTGEREAARAAQETYRVIADLVADHGELMTVHRRWECPPDVRDQIVENFDNVGVLGGAGALVRRPTASHPTQHETLLVRYGDGQGWSDAGVTLQPGESFRDCAKRGVAATTGLNVTVGSMLQAHVLYADDWTDRDPIARPFVLFEAHQGSGQAEPHGEVVDLRWFDTPPTKLRYEELGESF